MLIDVTSFTSGARQIENAVQPQKTANHIAVASRINGYIEALQPEFLRRVVCKPLCTQIDAYSRVEHRASVEVEETQQDGQQEQQVEYAEPDEIMESLIDLLKEPFADYVFFYMLRDMNVQPTITGLVRLKCANDYVSPLDKGVHTWNNMVDSLRVFVSEAELLGVQGVIIDKDLVTYINNFNL
ncbi:MAG: hypothetical protein J5733_02230 [Bacteroidaceae bacterium]|nr:hypothetical protein [Bacteroidaceae bacterium]